MTDQKRYDRQLRLWGEVGQARLEETRLLVIGSDCVATESLKSIILPGVGHVTIADDHVIDELDLETNFFVEVADEGKLRGEITLKNLVELNDRVTGEFKNMSFEQVLADKEFVNSFDIILCSNQVHENVVQLTDVTKNIIIEVTTNGFYGLVKTYFDSHVIFNIGDENMKMDLRIMNPFPRLQEYFDSIKINELTKDQHSHVPFPVILYTALGEWRKQHNTTGVPKGSEQQNQLRAIIKGMTKSLFLEENFGEAYSNVSYAYSEMSGNVSTLIADERATKSLKGMRAVDIEFWTFIHAVKMFMEKHGRRPIDSTLKDMICGNEYFTSLQKVFNDQLTEDATELLTFIENKMKEDGTTDVVKFDLEMVKRHCKTLRNMHFYDGVNGHENQMWEGNEWMLEAVDEEEKPLEDHLLNDLSAFLAVFKFYAKNKRYPCGEGDVNELFAFTKEVMTEKGLVGVEPQMKYVEEMCRFGGVQIHSSNAVIGSFIGQTVVHFAIHQFAGLNNTFFWDTQSCMRLAGKY